ncbi:MAG: hypothetical protein ABWY16_00430 [Pedobacter sp.]|uniref:hypothetical protein n=1 Tax=Pedobacter sp. TaxID=1411316 RepID=UPI003399B13B
MLRTLSYLNLIGTVCYFLAYLQNGNSIVITGLLGVIVYQWLSLRNQERGQSSWTVIQLIFAFLTLVFALYLGYGGFSLLLSLMEYQYYPLSSLTLVGYGLLLMFSLLFHLFFSWRANSVKKVE